MMNFAEYQRSAQSCAKGQYQANEEETDGDIVSQDKERSQGVTSRPQDREGKFRIFSSAN